jgi:hypothetical protein
MDPTHRESLGINIIRVLSVPYWSRIWIVQEMMLPGEASIFVGMKERNLIAFAYVLVGLITHLCDEDWLNGIEDAVQNLHSFQLILPQYTSRTMDTYYTSRTPSLVSLLVRYAQSGCVNKLDRIYGLLSLAQDGHKFPINYDIDIEALFRVTMRFCMDTRPLDDLLLAQL